MTTIARENEDFFSTAMPWVMLFFTLMPFLALIVSLVVGYIGLERPVPR